MLEKRCLSALRALTNLTSALFQLAAQKMNSRQFRRLFTKHCTEQQQNEPLRKVQQTQGQMRFEKWQGIVWFFNQRNMSGKKSAYAALVSNFFERDSANDVEQFDDILRTFVNETNTFENRFGKIRDEEGMFPVKNLMLQGL